MKHKSTVWLSSIIRTRISSALSDPDHTRAPFHSYAGNSCPILDPLCATITKEDSRLICYKQATDLDIWLTIECCSRITKIDSGPFNNPRITIFCDGNSATCKFSAFFHTIASGPVDTVSSCIEQLLPESSYVICPGILDYPPELRFKMKHLHQWGAIQSS